MQRYELPTPVVLWKTKQYRAVHVANIHYRSVGIIDEQMAPEIVIEKFMGTDAFKSESWTQRLDEGDYRCAVAELTEQEFTEQKK